MSSRVTSFVGLFDYESGINRIEIPLIQREYAQGRIDENVTRIRERFLDTLHKAIIGEESVGLDFVYGDVENKTLRPLDGQQRLTTLFLLHWYISSQTGHLDESQRWTQFAYATRPSARRFCEQLACHPIPSEAKPSCWIAEQPWYLYVWRHDPTVQAMLVMLDAIESKFKGDDFESAWQRLVDPDKPAISFHHLAVKDMGSAEDLYIKMNSRGKPLTDFENFKAQLEKSLQNAPRLAEIITAIDGEWADVMWHLRGEGNIFDNEFLKYIRYIVRICEWRDGKHHETKLHSDLDRAIAVFEPKNPQSDHHLSFLFDSFQAWIDPDSMVPIDTQETFERFLARSPTADAIENSKVVVFGNTATELNLLKVCCNTEDIGSGQAMLLYAVLIHRIHKTVDFSRRLRTLRNLIEASSNEIRPQAMPKLIADVWHIIVDGDIESVEAFNTEQRNDELLKRNFIAEHPDLESHLFQLEDQDVLRGCVMAFDLDPTNLIARTEIFRSLMSDSAMLPELTGALLTMGDYSRKLGADKRRLGSPHSLNRWRDLLAFNAPSRRTLLETRAALGMLLDRLTASTTPVTDELKSISREWIDQREREQTLDWRYYLVKYPCTRTGKSGIYAAAGGKLDYSFCMLEGEMMNGYYRDVVLLAIARTANLQKSVQGSIEYKENGPWYTGPASETRWMRLLKSGVRIRCTDGGFLVEPSKDPDLIFAFNAVCKRHRLAETDGGLALTVPQQEVDGTDFDTVDRVELGAALLTDLVGAGL